MSTNIIEKIAKLLNIEMYEEFKVKEQDDENPCATHLRLTHNGLEYFHFDSKAWMPDTSNALTDLITGVYEPIKIPFIPNKNNLYYRPEMDFCQNSPVSQCYCWKDDFVDYAYLHMGMVYRTKKECNKHLTEDFEKIKSFNRKDDCE